MISGLVLFENPLWRQLRPLTDTLPVPALAFGGSTLGERWLSASRAPLVGIAARAEVMATWDERPALAPPPPADAEPKLRDAYAGNKKARDESWARWKALLAKL